MQIVGHLNILAPSLFPLGSWMKAWLLELERQYKLFFIRRSCTAWLPEIRYIWWFPCGAKGKLTVCESYSGKVDERKHLPLPHFIGNILFYFVMMVSFWFRGVEAKAASMCGPRETAAATTTATAMAMLQACGQSPSTQPSTTAARLCTTRAAPPPWPPHSATAARGTQRLAWWVLNWAKVPRDWKRHQLPLRCCREWIWSPSRILMRSGFRPWELLSRGCRRRFDKNGASVVARVFLFYYCLARCHIFSELRYSLTLKQHLHL